MTCRCMTCPLAGVAALIFDMEAGPSRTKLVEGTLFRDLQGIAIVPVRVFRRLLGASCNCPRAQRRP